MNVVLLLSDDVLRDLLGLVNQTFLVQVLSVAPKIK